MPAIDIGVRMDTSNDVLAMFDARLKGRFFQKAKTPADPQQAELDLPVSDLPVVVFPDLGAQRWEREYEGYVFEVRTDTGEAVKIGACKLAKFRFSFVEGGSTIVTFRVQSNASIGKEEYGTLGMLLDRDVEAALTPPAEGEQASVFGEVKPLGDGSVVAIDAKANGKKKPGPQISAEAAWPFPGEGAGATAPPSGNVLAEGDTPARRAAVTRAKRKAEQKAAEATTPVGLPDPSEPPPPGSIAIDPGALNQALARNP